MTANESEELGEANTALTVAPRPTRVVARGALGDLAAAVERLETWGVTVPAGSRLHEAKEVLEAAAESGVLAPIHRGDDLGLRALEFVFDYSAISASLPANRVANLRKDLERSLKGPLDPVTTSREPAQLQSQAVVRAAFVQSGLDPKHPTGSPRHGKSPDLLLENGLSTYGIEVKRPEKAGNVLPRFRDGCTQLSDYGVSGGVLVDVSDCVRGQDIPAASSFVHEHGGLILEEVFETGVGPRPGYGHIMMAGVYARVAWSSDDGPDSSMVRVHTASRIGIMAQVQGSLQDHRAKWMRQHFQSGLYGLTRALHHGATTQEGGG